MIEVDLAKAGMVITATEILIKRPVRFGRNANIVGDITIAGDVTVAEDINVGGEVVGDLVSRYRIPFTAFDCGTNATVSYVVVPTGGGGRISRVSWVLTTAQAGGANTITLAIEGGSAIAPANPVVISQGAAGVSGDTVFASSLNFNVVAANDIISMTVTQAVGTGGIINGSIEITRT